MGGRLGRLKRKLATDPAPKGEGHFSLDAQLDLVAGGLCPSRQDHLVHLVLWMPFERAVQMPTELTRVQVSSVAVRDRNSYRAGEAVQTAQVNGPAPQASASIPQSKQIISADGAMVYLLKGQWTEVKTNIVGQVEVGKLGEAVHIGSMIHLVPQELFRRTGLKTKGTH